MLRVVVTVPGSAAGDPGGAELLDAAGAELTFHACTLATPADELVEVLSGAQAVLAGSEVYSDIILDAASSVRHIARVGVGFDSIDLAAASARGVLVTTTPGANHLAVADHAIGMLIALAHGIVRDHSAIALGTWSTRTNFGVTGRTLGLIGLGRVGQAVAERASVFGLRLLAHEPAPDPAFVRRYGVQLKTADEVLATSDFVSLHLPLSQSSKGWLDGRRLALMRPGAFVINTARGGLVIEDDLYAALAEGRLAGAALDVRTIEPTVDDRFARLPNVILTPHSAARTVDVRRVSSRMAAEAVLSALKGQPPAGLVNPEAWPGFAAAL